MSDGVSLVTGATGFIGSAIARALVERGERVRILMRPGADDRNVADLPIERAYGDLCNEQLIAKALEGCRHLYHAAAHYSLWSRDDQAMYRSNREGTRTILLVALAAGLERVVYTSTVGTLGIPPRGPGSEDTPVSFQDMVGGYKRSKFLAEQDALMLAQQGLPLVVVYPSTPIGAGDLKPTPTGQVIVNLLRGRIPAYVETGLNFVAVRDVAEGHLLAMRYGRIGGRYILGHRNMMLSEFLALVAAVAGRRAPRIRLPLSIALAVGLVSEAASRVTGRPPMAPLAGVLMARKRMFFEGSRAVRELGMPQTPIELAVEEAVRWFTDRGYAS